MDNQQKLTRAFLLALALHLTLLGLFALSALFKPKAELMAPEADIIHATVVEQAESGTKRKPSSTPTTTPKETKENEQPQLTVDTAAQKAEFLTEQALAKADAEKKAAAK